MKRRLAMLLALSLTLASFSVTGVSAAEGEAADTQVVTEAQAEVPAEETEVVEETKEETTEEAAVETTEEAPVETTEEAVEETTEEAPAETTEEAVEEATEEAPAETTEEAAVEEVTEEAAEEEAETVSKDSADAADETVTEEVIDPEEAKVTGDVVEEKAVEKSGWQDNYTTYYVNGKPAKNKWITAKAKNGKTYTFYFGSDGKKYTGWKRVKGIMYFFANNRYPAMPEGARLTGFKTISGYVFYFADSRISGHPTGEQITGWATISGKKYYFMDERYTAYNKSIRGARMTGFKTIDGVKYYFADSRYTAAKVPTGVMLTGWKTIKGQKYYFADSRYPKAPTGKMLTGIKTIGGKAYFFNKYGVMKTGWVRTTNDVWGYYTSNGTAGKVGWKQKDDDWYYLTKSGRAKTGWLTLGSSRYYLNADKGGKMVIGPHKFPSGRIYFFDGEGRLVKTEGWKYYEGGSYYTYSTGRVAVNTTIDGVKVDSTGRAEMSKMDIKAQNYSSDTNYLILVDKSTYTVCIYKGKKGAWVRVKGEWRCTHGGSRTPSGEWHTAGHLTKRSAEYGWGDFEYTSAAYCTHISAGNFFHSILFDKYSRTNPYNLSPVDPNLGMNYSHGCIRLTVDNAKWIWDNVPTNTKVVVYNS